MIETVVVHLTDVETTRSLLEYLGKEVFDGRVLAVHRIEKEREHSFLRQT